MAIYLPFQFLWIASTSTTVYVRIWFHFGGVAWFLVFSFPEIVVNMRRYSCVDGICFNFIIIYELVLYVRMYAKQACIDIPWRMALLYVYSYFIICCYIHSNYCLWCIYCSICWHLMYTMNITIRRVYMVWHCCV